MSRLAGVVAGAETRSVDIRDAEAVRAAFEEAMREVPLRRMSEPSEIAGTVAWLLSDDAVGVTGQAIDHNNGAFMV